MLSTYLKHSSQLHRFGNRALGRLSRLAADPATSLFFGRIPLIYTIGAMQEFNFPKASLPLFCDWVTGLMGDAPLPPAPRRPHSEPLSTGTVCQSGGDGYKSQSRLQTACLRIEAFLTLFCSPLTFAVLLLMYTAIKANGTSLT